MPDCPISGDRVHQIAQSAEANLMTAEALLTSSVVDIHNLISRTFVTPSPIQDDKPEIKWEWGDLLHWRTTGRFTRTISEIARKNNNPQWLAYACGYKTHVATDFVGHPYVNQVAGGPGLFLGNKTPSGGKFYGCLCF